MTSLINFRNNDWIKVPERNSLDEVEEHIKNHYNSLEILYEDLIIYNTYSNKLSHDLQINDLKLYKYNWNTQKIEIINL